MQARAERAMQRLAAGIALVSVRHPDGRPRSAIAASFNSVSLDPPMVLWCMPAADFEALAMAENCACGLSILSEHQARFAEDGPGKPPEPLWDCGDVFGVPLLAGASAAFEVIVTRCSRHGGNVLCFGDLGRISYAGAAPGLLRYGGEVGVAAGPN